MPQQTILPHIYYTVSELSSIRDVTALKNFNVKTIAYINDDRAYEVDLDNSSTEDSKKYLELDLRHTDRRITGMKPYLIFGVLYIKNQLPAVSVKSLKQFGGDFENLIVYHHQLLAVRKKSNYFEERTVKN